MFIVQTKHFVIDFIQVSSAGETTQLPYDQIMKCTLTEYRIESAHHEFVTYIIKE